MKCSDKIVKKPVKVDFHIHSIASKWKDGDKVKNCTIENLPILIKKLNDNKVNIISITDHDNFDYDIYLELKKEEQKTSSSINKVIPGVEFDVKIDKEILHIITLFNDSDNSKIKLIHSEIFDDKINKPKFKSYEDCFSKTEFLNILRKIDNDFVLIVHQKGSPYSKKKKKHDFSNLSESIQNELLCVGFFDAFEFKNKNNEIFNKLNAKDVTCKSNDKIYITGSDSHDWRIYPDSKDSKFDNFTYLKCLPSFRGVTLALTSKTRSLINADNFFNCTNNINAINLSINECNQEIILSKGINAIIGDNSIGKSLLLHKLTNYEYAKKVKTSYDKFLKSNKININTNINKDELFRFDYQGHIRSLFENSKTSSVFGEYYPEKPEYELTKEEIERKINDFIDFLNNKTEYDKKLTELNNITIKFDESRSVSDIKSLSIQQDLNEEKIKDDIKSLYDIKKLLNVLLGNANNILENKLFEVSDKNIIKKFWKKINELYSKYTKILEQKKSEKTKILTIIMSLDTFKYKLSNEKTNRQEQYEKYNESFQNLSKQISNIVLFKNKLNCNLKIEDSKLEEVKPKVSSYDKYSFVSKTKCTKFDENYIFNLLKKFLKTKYADTLKIGDIEKIDPKVFEENIKLQTDEKNIFDEYKNKILKEIDEDFTIDNYITLKSEQNKQINANKLSNGTNALMFFDLLSYKDESGVYLVDQPEDDVSQKSIHDKLIAYLQKISHKHQIILITHNPQLVVNLDVDNVIFISKDDETGAMSIKYGALEYKNVEDKTNILDIIVNNLEGGLLALKERYNRYEKNN